MAESVSVEHGGVTITSNTVSEADLRAEMEAPQTAQTDADRRKPSAQTAQTDANAAPVRDERGRFTKPEAGSPMPPEAEAPSDRVPPDPAAAPARRRDDTLPKHNPVTRLHQALAAKLEAERHARELEDELARYRQPPASAPVAAPVPAVPSGPQGGPPEPQFEQFAEQADPYTSYMQAWARWDHAQQLTQVRAAWEADQAEKTKAQSLKARLDAGKTSYQDFDNVLKEADTLGLQVSAVMQAAIAESPRAADLVYFLATHPEECTQLAEESQQTPVAAATVMQRLLESHLAPRPVPTSGTGTGARASVSTAKPPVTPVGSSPVVSDEPPGDAASAAEHARYWNRRLKVPGT